METRIARASPPDPGHRVVTPSTVFRYQQHHPLHSIFAPKCIAVVGATERPGSVGRTLLWNLISHPFGGTVFPVNPKRTSVLGIKAYPHLAALPAPVDLAVIATPAPTVPGIIMECVETGVKGAIIISSGFKESGAAGAELERHIRERARQGKLRIIGPNCLGVMCPISGLNATFASTMVRPGHVGFISQSGALCTAVLDWSQDEHVGFSAFISIGSMMDVGWGDLIDYLGSDVQTTSIVLYMETVGDARSFLSAAREAALSKPIIILKAGRTQEASLAAVSHTGTLTGRHEVFEAACRRCGVLPVNRIDELFSMAEVLAKQPRPQEPHLTILTNAGGPGVLATDALISCGGELTTLVPQTITALDQILPAHWSHHNPVDILGDADAERYTKALEIVAHELGMSAEALPQPAIRPYPMQYVQPWTLRNGSAVTIRPIRPEDEPLMVTFHERLSARSIYFRWLHMLNLSRRTAHEEMIRLCFIDYDREMALVAEYDNPETGQHEIIGIGSLIKEQGVKRAEFALLVIDHFQGQGLGTELLRRLMQVGRDEHLQCLMGEILLENQGMQEICKKLGFRLQYSLEDQVVHVELVL